MFNMQKWLQNNIFKALFKTRRAMPCHGSTTIDIHLEVNDDLYNDSIEQFIKANIGNMSQRESVIRSN